MGISVHWDSQEQQVIRLDCETWWDLDDFYAAKEQARAMMQGIRHHVHLIFNLNDSRNIPTEYFIFNNLTGSDDAPANLGKTIIVASARLLQNLYGMFGKMYQQMLSTGDLLFVPSVDEARLMLQRQMLPA